MAKYAIEDTTLTGIADAIRSKTGGTEPIATADMAEQIGGITTEPVLQEKTATKNGTVTADEGYDGLSKVTVSVADSSLPIEVSTEAEMTALLESGEVGGVYKYTGETTDTYENGALYVFEDVLQGTWVFNDTIDFSNDAAATSMCGFMQFKVGTASINLAKLIVYFGTQTINVGRSTGSPIALYSGSTWASDNYKTIIIDTTYDKLTVASVSTGTGEANVVTKEQFFAWLKANATKQSGFIKLIQQTEAVAEYDGTITVV